MSSSEEVFDIDNISGGDSESDGYVPATKKKTKAPQKPVEPSKKAAPKSRVVLGTTKKPTKVLKEIDENGPKDVMNVDPESDSDVQPSSSSKKVPLQAKGKDKTATEMYQKLTQLQHILKRPDSYIGSVEAHTQHMWIYDSENNRMANREITYVPGFFKLWMRSSLMPPIIRLTIRI